MNVRSVVTTVVDQGFSAGSNLIIILAVARVSGLSEFGAFSLAYAFFAFGLGTQRAFLGTLVSLAQGRLTRFEGLLSVVWAAVVACMGTAVLLATSAFTTAGFVLLLGCAIAYPQDLFRFRRIADGKSGRAAVSDGIWFVVSVLLFGATLLLDDVSGTAIILGWALAGGLSALLVIGDLSLFRPRAAGEPPLIVRRDVTTLLPDAVLTQLVPVAVPALVAAQMTLEAVAAQRGAGTLMSPISLLMGALPLVVLPLMARAPAAVRERISTVQSAAMVTVIVAWGALLLLLPDAVGVSLLGDAWEQSRTLLLLAVVEMVIWGVIGGVESLNRSHRRWGVLLANRIFYAVTALLLVSLAVRSGNMQGVMAAMAVAALALLVLNVVAIVRYRGQDDGDGEAAAAGASSGAATPEL